MPREQPNKWEKREVILKAAGPLVGAMLVAVLGLIGKGYLENKHRRESQVQLYTQLISQREQAESKLRGDMFSKIIDRFWSDSTPPDEEMELKVLSLELLAYNFHESMNLKPLFMHLNRKLMSTQDTADFGKRLKRVAGEVKYRQISALKGHKADFKTITFHLPSTELESENRIFYEDHFDLTVDGITRHFTLSAVQSDSAGESFGIILDTSESLHCYAADKPDSIQQKYTPTSDSSDSMRDLLGEFGLPSDEEPPPEDSTSKDEVGEARSKDQEPFGVEWFDFPMIDNTRLGGPHDHRLAVVITRWDEDAQVKGSPFIQLEVLCFSGKYAGLKEKQFYDDILNQLKIEPTKDKDDQKH
jgi:hypothetical protein